MDYPLDTPQGTPPELTGEIGLEFFGTMSASLSHEIKNALASVNENAGLIQDYAGMAQDGKPLDPDRMQAIAGKIRNQVQRADSIVKNLNRLAHSIHASRTPTDVNELMGFLFTLCERISATRGVRIELQPSATPVNLATNPFILKNLVWRCLDYAMDRAGGDGGITLSVEDGENGIQIRLTGLDNPSEVSKNPFPGKRERALLTSLGADLEVHPESGECTITLFREGR